ncbi:MAG: hypothetical protein C4K49_10620 [Candidatus Thorarchaeota archaeon]|nr:MAG: hypothetical protein C4K49_10620 [Candidatus Thorarchaeota archaeon]
MDGKENKDQNLDAATLEKSWNEACEDLRKSLGDGATPAVDKKELEEANAILAKSGATADELKKAQTILAKAMSASDKGEGAEQEEEESISTEESESESTPPPAKKSFEEAVAEDDPEAEIAMDIEPYLKSLAHEIGESLEKARKPLDRLAKLEKSVSELSSIVKAIGKAVLANAEMQKSIKTDIAKFGSIEIPSMARLRKGGDRFQVEEGGAEMTVMEVMAKATELCRKGEISTTDISILESRLQSGGGIPESMKPLFAKKV